MQKKNMWEIIGDSSGRPGQRAKVKTNTSDFAALLLIIDFIDLI